MRGEDSSFMVALRAYSSNVIEYLAQHGEKDITSAIGTSANRNRTYIEMYPSRHIALLLHVTEPSANLTLFRYLLPLIQKG